jgi:NADH-quinone oxidoreductase subunit E
MSHLPEELLSEARSLMELYPEKRSALIPICHLVQGHEGWLSPQAIEEVADLLGLSPAEVQGTASFYDMLHTEPVGKYLVGICTNIACMLSGAYELLEHAEKSLGIAPGETTRDELFTLEETECLAGCDMAPCVQVNYRFVGKLDESGFDALIEDLKAGKRSEEIPPHGVLCRVKRAQGLLARDGGAGEGVSAKGGSK